MAQHDGLGDAASVADLDRVAAVYEDLAEHGERLGVTVAWQGCTGTI